MVTETPDQPITGLWLSDTDNPYGRRQATRPFAELDPIVISELIRDLTSVFA